MRISTLICVYIFILHCGTALSGEGIFSEGDLIQLGFAPYIYHYNHGRNYNATPWYTGLEWETAERWELGAAYFSNSYNQPCGYVYGGRRFIAGSPDSHLFLKITAGAILGYVHPYESKIPVNKDGVGLGVIPAVGYKYKRMTAQIAVLSMSGLMLNFGYDIWK